MNERRDSLDDGSIDVTPASRDIYFSLARGGYNLATAVEEYVDNSLEQAMASKSQSRRKIVVSSMLPNAENIDSFIEILDDCGGCRRVEAANFIQPGKSGIDPMSGKISRFGFGGKAAGLAVAERVEISSRSPGETGWTIILDKENLKKKSDWKFRFESIPPSGIKEGSTRIRLYLSSDKKIDIANFPSDVSESLRKRYSSFNCWNADVFVGTTKIEATDPYSEILKDDFAPEGAKPLKIERQISLPMRGADGVSRIQTLNILITTGLKPSGTALQEFGANIYCNCRLLVENNKTGVEGEVGHPNNPIVWLRSIVEMKGPAELMPWNNRKDGLDKSSPSYKKLEELLVESYKEFTNLIGEAKQHYKDRTGERVPKIRDMIVENLERQYKKHNKDPEAFPESIRRSGVFRDAVERNNNSGVPVTTKPKDVVQISAPIDKSTLEILRSKVKEVTMKDRVTNVDIVEEVFKHYIECQVK